MEKIVVLNGFSEEDGMLINCLKVLFPECEIRVGSNQMERLSDQKTDLVSIIACEGGEENGKHINR
jgi:hypothetical protein